MSQTQQAIVLYHGAHSAQECADGQRCLFEWYNWLTRQQNTDSCPPGVSPLLYSFGVALNDLLPDSKRQRLTRFLPNGTSPLAGTAGDGLDLARSYLALDWLAREYLPAWMDAAGLAGHGAALRGLPPLRDPGSVRTAGPVLAAARDAAGASARAAARDADWDAARDAARASAGASARAAARDADWDADWDAWASAGASAGAAARAAARASARASARDADWDAAVLAPTVSVLQDSAIGLYGHMMHPKIRLTHTEGSQP